MHVMGFDRNIIQLTRNYLSNRTFAVQLEGKQSSTRKILAGAPQGGILSAIYYLLYTNDFPEMPKAKVKINRIMFADDTILYTTTEKIKLAQNEMNEYLKKIANYVKNWKLKLNVTKTEAISIVGQYKDLTKSVRKNALDIKLNIDNQKINILDKVKYLGLIISKNYKSINHINYVIGKVNSAKAQLKTAFDSKHLNKKVKLLMYKQLIRPIILYACPCWMQTSSHQIERIRIIERWFLRKISGLYKKTNSVKFFNSKMLYESTNVNRIDRKMIENNLKFIEKIRNNDDQHIKEIAQFDSDYMTNNKYKPLNYYDHLNRNGLLYENKKLLLFNKGSTNPNSTVYVTNQNDESNCK